MSETRTISFMLNGEAVSAEILPHHNLIDVLQQVMEVDLGELLTQLRK